MTKTTLKALATIAGKLLCFFGFHSMKREQKGPWISDVCTRCGSYQVII